jgi:hypothetical protein
MRFLINVWIAINCIGQKIGTVVVEPGRCVEPAFGLAFRANGTHVSVTDSCTQTKYINTIPCDATGGCCLVPETMSVNVTETTLNITPNSTRYQSSVGLPEPKNGRVFVCTEQFVG